ncbi:hypothetical protein CAPTEDRAFT_177112 [Capitella teleta]|uniref:Isochorismatase-like domain-containing protein n=1 Tax=Capitella teleta TaxID=283909 RepID=R7V112_CAPTE|nr:hypothetical protein CAPTEDRAFT_177112 [Capitella teleta]|eukprot:ELU12199.1 hypothetical protein CAPTEDRAFT_177112 [Capitella teleta]
MAARIARASIKNSGLFLCDMQEAFRKTISYYPSIIEVSKRMLEGAKTLDMPVFVTEQYPKRLGSTVSELDVSGLSVFPKTHFSMYLPELLEKAKDHPDMKSVIICGIEGHVCVLQSVLDFLEHGYDVHVIADGVSSRSMTDRMFALQRMREAGAVLTTSEAMLLGLVQGSDHPQFRKIQKIIWDAPPDSGLLSQRIDEGTPV